MKKIGLQFDISTASSSKELAEVEIRLNEIAASLRKAKKAGDTDTFSRLRTEQIALQQSASKLRKEIRGQVKDFEAAKLPTDSIERLRREYARLSSELIKLDTKDAGFPEKAAEAKALNDRIKTLEKSLGDTRRNVGNYREDIEGALSGVSNAIGGNISALAAGLGAGGLVVAGIDLASQGLQTVRELSKEVVELRGTVQQVTGLTGDALVSSTERIQALAKTFGKDSKEIITAANNAAKGFEVDFGTALDSLETALLSGADAQGNLLDKFREYPTQIANAGGSIEDFIKLATQEVQGGIYDDKLLDSIKEADLSLKEFTATQQKALEPLGEEFAQTLAEDIQSGSVTTIEAIRRIRDQSEKLGLDLKETQTITADVFKGAGEDAGSFEKVIDNVFTAIDGEYSSLIDTSNQLVTQQQKALRANEEFAKAQGELADVLGTADGSLKTFTTRLKTGLIVFLVAVIQRAKEFFSVFRPLGTALVDLSKALGIVDNAGRATTGALKLLNNVSKVTDFVIGLVVKSVANLVDGFTKAVNGVRNFAERLGLVKDRNQQIADQVEKTKKKIDENTKDLQKGFEDLKKETEGSNDQTKDLTKNLDKLNNVADKVAKTGIAALRSKVSELNTELANAETPEAYARIADQIDVLEKQIEETEARYKRFREITSGAANVVSELGRRGETSLTGAVDTIVQTTGLEGSAEAEKARREAELISQIKSSNEEQQTAKLKEERDRQLEIEEEYYESRAEIIGNASEQFSESLTELLASGEANLKDFGKIVLTIALDTAQQVVNLAIAELFAKQVAQAGIAGLAKAAVLQGLIKGFTSAIFGTIRSNIQELAEGGEVLPSTRPGVITQAPNAPTTRKGDNILIYAKRGEMVLNEGQQRRAKNLFGRDVFGQIGVPGFNTGGIVSTAPLLVNPNPASNNSTLAIEDIQIQQLAQEISVRTATETATRTADAVGRAIFEANARAERLRNLRESQIK